MTDDELDVTCCMECVAAGWSGAWEVMDDKHPAKPTGTNRVSKQASSRHSMAGLFVSAFVMAA